jgi:hypothetical protein
LPGIVLICHCGRDLIAQPAPIPGWTVGLNRLPDSMSGQHIRQ